MLHLHTQSDGATGGVYKGQGLIQHELITHAYKTLPVEDQKFQRARDRPKPIGHF